MYYGLHNGRRTRLSFTRSGLRHRSDSRRYDSDTPPDNGSGSVFRLRQAAPCAYTGGFRRLFLRIPRHRHPGGRHKARQYRRKRGYHARRGNRFHDHQIRDLRRHQSAGIVPCPCQSCIRRHASGTPENRGRALGYHGKDHREPHPRRPYHLRGQLHFRLRQLCVESHSLRRRRPAGYRRRIGKRVRRDQRSRGTCKCQSG